MDILLYIWTNVLETQQGAYAKTRKPERQRKGENKRVNQKEKKHKLKLKTLADNLILFKIKKCN